MAYHIAGGQWDHSVDVKDEHSWIEVLQGDIQNIELVAPTPDEGACASARQSLTFPSPTRPVNCWFTGRVGRV